MYAQSENAELLGLKEKIRKFNVFDREANNTFFRTILTCVNVVVAGYVVIYGFFGIWTSSLLLLVGLSAFAPAIHILDRKGCFECARLLFIFACSYYMCASAFGLELSAGVQFYCFPAAMLGLMLFDFSQIRHITFAVICPFLCWVFIQADFHSTEQMILQSTFQTIAIINFVGAFSLMTTFLAIFIHVATQRQRHEFQTLSLASKAVQDSSKEIDQFFNLSLDLLCIMKPDGTIKKVNPAFASALGHPSAALNARQLLEFVHPEDIEATRTNLEKVLAGDAKIHFENRCRHHCGEFRFFTWRYAFDPQSGAVFAAGRDVTEKRKQNLELRQMIDAINRSAIVATTDTSGKLISVNDNFCAISGYSRDELLGENNSLLNSGAHSQEFFENIWQTISSGMVWSGEIQNRAKDGKPYFVQTVISPIIDAFGKIDRYLEIRFDVTQQREMQAELDIERAKVLQSSKLAEIGEMSAMIAHEINNPLAIISGAASALSRNEGDEATFLTMKETITRSVSRIAKIVLMLRKFSRTTDTHEWQVVPLSNIISEALILTEIKAKHSSVHLELDLQSETPISCNQIAIEQVLVNLINNGINAASVSSDKWVRLSTFDDKNEVVCQVSNSGDLICPEIEKKMFEPFFTTKSAGEGTGLGLSITRDIVSQHRATIALNRAKENTCFEIRFRKSMSIQIAG